MGSNPSGPLLRFALSVGSINWYVSTSTPGVLTYLYKDREDNSLILYAVNREGTGKEIEVSLQVEALGLGGKEKYEWEEVTGGAKHEIPGERPGHLSLHVEGNSVGIWRLRSS